MYGIEKPIFYRMYIYLENIRRVKMLEQNDLQAIAELIDIRVTKTEDMFSGRFDNVESEVGTLKRRFEGFEDKMRALDEKISDVERTLVNELVRTEDKLTRRISKIEKELEELKEGYKTNRLEDGNWTMMFQILEDFQKRLEAMERKIA